MRLEYRTAAANRHRAFTLVEVMVGSGFLAFTVVSFYLALSAGFGFVRLARENMRATQILTEKMETIRLYSWDQVNMVGFIPTNFTTSFYPPAVTNAGIEYAGSLRILPSPLAPSYSNDLRWVEVEVTWTSGNVERRRKMTTLVSQYGIQHYKSN